MVAGATPRTTDTTTATAPDGTRAFGIEPYVAVRGGWEEFQSDSVPGAPRQNKLNGSLVEGLAGVNIPLGPVFVGAEGNVAKGVSGVMRVVKIFEYISEEDLRSMQPQQAQSQPQRGNS